MRTSDLALVLIRLTIQEEPHLVLIRHRKWGDWSLVGGHLEPEERSDWARAARRECNEELAPLRYGADFTLLPLLDRPVRWGPVPSRSAGNVPTIYTAQFFALRFLRPPAECLAQLPAENFCIVREADVAVSSPAGDLPLPARALQSVRRPSLAWDMPLSSAPALHA